MKTTINIAITGCISVGKSTFLNALCGYEYSSVGTTKTTMIPQLYTESDENATSPEIIKEANDNINKNTQKKINSGKFDIHDCHPVYYNINKIMYINGIKLNLYDTPGLNDVENNEIYMNWLYKNMDTIDILVYITDIYNGLHSSQEIDIVNKLLEKCKEHNTKFIPLLNKCDNMYYENDDLIFQDSENLSSLDFVNDKMKLLCLENDMIVSKFFPISSEKYFIYNSIAKNSSFILSDKYKKILLREYFGTSWENIKNITDDSINEIIIKIKDNYDELELDTGFPIFQQILSENIKNDLPFFLKKKIDIIINKLEKCPFDNVENITKKFKKYISHSLYLENSYRLDDIEKIFINYITNYNNSINGIIDIIKSEINESNLDQALFIINDYYIKYKSLITNIKNIKFTGSEKHIKNINDTIFNSIMFYLDNIDFKNIDQENNSNKLLNKVINFVIHNSINKNIIIMKCIKKYSDTNLINTQQQIDFIQELLTEIDSHKYITISLCIIFFNRYNSINENNIYSSMKLLQKLSNKTEPRLKMMKFILKNRISDHLKMANNNIFEYVENYDPFINMVDNIY